MRKINSGRFVRRVPVTTQARPAYRNPARRLAVNESIYSLRQRTARIMGQQFGGERDLYEALGYQPTLSVDDYEAFYRREVLAKRLVNKPADSTWQKPPIIKDGNEASSDEKPKSKFIQALQILVNKNRLWHYLNRVDRLAGLGCYGVLWIGVREPEGVTPDQPLNTSLLTGPESITWFISRSEKYAAIASWDKNPQSPRYGLPETYSITVGNQSGIGTQNVHWTRIIHVAEGKTNDETYGTPRLEAPMDRLFDLQKVVGGSAEAFWQVVNKGLAILAEEGGDFESDSAALDAFQTEVDSYLHNRSKIMQLAGVKDIKDLGSSTVDPSAMFGVLVSLLAADADMPQAILVGTTKNGLGGDASGETDQKLWNDTIEYRRKNFSEPEILRPCLNWFILNGILPKPKAVEYTVLWESNYNPPPKEKAETAKFNAEALKIFAEARLVDSDLVMPAEIFTERYFDFVPDTTPEVKLMDEDKVLEEAEAEVDGQQPPGDQGEEDLSEVMEGRRNGNSR